MIPIVVYGSEAYIPAHNVIIKDKEIISAKGPRNGTLAVDYVFVSASLVNKICRVSPVDNDLITLFWNQVFSK